MDTDPELPARTDAWFPWPPATAGVPLVCCAHAGGGAIAYRGWSAALAGRVQVWASERPGRGTRIREPAALDLPALAEGLAGAVAASVPEEPLLLFGHSMGAAVAFEVARHLEARRGPGAVRHLVVAGAWPPGERRRRPQPLHTLSDDDLVRALASFGGTPPEVLARSELMDLLAPAVRADLEAHYRYRPEPGATVAAPIAVLLGEDDGEVDPEAARGWDRFTEAACEIEVLPGDHFFVRSAAETVLARIAALAGGSSPEGAP